LVRLLPKKITSTYCQLIPENSNILELGCGQGDLLSSLRPNEGVGVDFSKFAIDRAISLYPHLEFIHADAQIVELGSRTFDYIVVSELVNDVWDVQTLLESIKNIALPVPGSYLIFIAIFGIFLSQLQAK